MLRIAIALLLLPIMACKPIAEHSETEGLAILSARWPDPSNIPLCWVNPQAVSPSVLSALKSASDREFGKTNIRITRFTPCTEADYAKGAKVIRAGLEVVNKEESKSVSFAGVAFYGPVDTQFGDLSSRGLKRSSRASLLVMLPEEIRNNFTGNTANARTGTFLHEIGHVIGIVHEQKRSDVSTDCLNKLGGNNPSQNSAQKEDLYNRYIGKYDAASVLNYCNPRVPTLSAGDIATVNFLYPKPIVASTKPETFALRSTDTLKCLRKENAGEVSTGDCEGQNWVLKHQADGSFFLAHEASENLCLDEDAMKNTTKLSACGSTPTQALHAIFPELNIVPSSEQERILREFQFVQSKNCLRIAYDTQNFRGRAYTGPCSKTNDARDIKAAETTIELIGAFERFVKTADMPPAKDEGL